MKYFKIFALALGALALTACSNDEDWNTASGVSVEFTSSDYVVKENAGNFQIPLKVTGEANGPIKVQVKVEGTGTNPALPFEERDGKWSGNFVLTSDALNIPAGEEYVSLDFQAVDDQEENANRTFSITITTVEGATAGTISTTTVTIRDNDGVPYEKIQGNWKFNFTDYDGNKSSYSCTISGAEDGTPEYGKELVLEGLLNNPTALTLYYDENEATGEVFVSMVLPEPIIWYDSSNYIWVIGTAANGNPSLAETTVTGVYDAANQTITFEPQDKIWFYVASPDFSSQLGIYESATGITMTR